MPGNRVHVAPLVFAGIWLAFGIATQALAQTNPLPSRVEPVTVDSGLIRGPVGGAEVAWSAMIEVPDAPWMRLAFRQALLAEDPRTGESSTLRITSLLDGAVQTLNARGMAQWGKTSAYFNGPAVLLELLAAPNGRTNWIAIDEVTVGVFEEGGIGSICGPTDDRQLSEDVRAARLVPIGCSGWLFDDANHCFLTAGHCAGSSMQVAEFNVPLSNGSGQIQHPGPEDQYPVDPASVQNTDGGVGNDWCYFGCFENSQTGLTAGEAQGDWFTLATPPPVQGQNIRITGYGTTSSPVPPQWNQVQKTHAGPYTTFSGTTVQYQTDTTGGNSGSPVINDDTGEAIGIHTHGGCTSGGGANSGTGSNHSGLQDALANPQGVCRAGLDFAYPDGRPGLVSDLGGTTMRVVVGALGSTDPAPDTGQLHVDVGSGFVTLAMTVVSPNVYDAVFPAAPCGGAVRFYVSAEATSGTRFFNPSSAPASFYSAVGGGGEAVVLADDFQQNQGWTVENVSLTEGAWERAVPTGGGDRGDPPDDYDGSGLCFVTDNTDNADVDGGPTRMISPTLDLSSPGEYYLSYARWFTNDDNDADRLVVEVSANDGGTWTVVESVSNSTGWTHRSVRINDYVAPSAAVRIRFSATDNPNNSVTEAGVDAFRVARITCSPSHDPGDMNCDGSINGADISPFVLALTDPNAYAAAYPECRLELGDFTGDGSVNGQDIAGFVDALTNP